MSCFKGSVKPLRGNAAQKINMYCFNESDESLTQGELEPLRAFTKNLHELLQGSLEPLRGMPQKQIFMNSFFGSFNHFRAIDIDTH